MQLALSEGAEVFGTTSAPFVAYVESLGVRGVVDQAAPTFESVVPEVDLVLDTLGGDLLRRSYGVLRPGGRVVSTVEVPEAEILATYQLRGHHARPSPDGATLHRVLQRAAAHRIETKVAQVLPLARAAQALELAQLPGTPGKVILQIPG
ncbi:zinc-binding dehydrogenase [Hymenobacter arizonensis]|uniref:zinc-binding dehydrogenase n=1 Tax=Hymenobacter arizonensis TaxID=1227077 RepID=UPI0015A54430|nr:zinc-binding dehydrogenase [Hymenobacter arizonensis]